MNSGEGKAGEEANAGGAGKEADASEEDDAGEEADVGNAAKEDNAGEEADVGYAANAGEEDNAADAGEEDDAADAREDGVDKGNKSVGKQISKHQHTFITNHPLMNQICHILDDFLLTALAISHTIPQTHAMDTSSYTFIVFW